MQSVTYPDGLIETRLYMAERDKDAFAAMDADLAEAEKKGGRLAHRGKIGRNAACPCNSGRKFKKCCMSGAKRIGTI